MEIFDIEDIFKFLNMNPDVMRIRKLIHKNNVISYSSVYEGLYFKSCIESDFYLLIKDHVLILDTNKSYENSRLMYDFKIDYMGKIYYIEICGGISQEYYTMQNRKQKEFGSVLISRRGFKTILDDIKENKGLKHEYF